MKKYITNGGQEIKVSTDRRICRIVCKNLGIEPLYPGDKVTHPEKSDIGTVVGVAPAIQPLVIWVKFPFDSGIVYSYGNGTCDFKKI